MHTGQGISEANKKYYSEEEMKERPKPETDPLV